MSEHPGVNPASWISRLQRSTGFIIALSSGAVASLLFFRLVVHLDYSVVDALKDYYVNAVLFFGVIAFMSTFTRPKVGQWVQLAMLFTVSLLSASTVTFGDLTPLVYFGLFIGYGTAYDKITRYKWRLFVPAAVITVLLWTRRVEQLVDGPVLAIALSASASVMIGGMLVLLVRTVVLAQASRRQELESQVADRTRDLTKALTESRNLARRNAALLHEVYHRTGNSLQVVASLLALQNREGPMTGEATKRGLEKAETQIQIMANIHNLYHRTEKVFEIPLRDFFLEVASGLRRTDLVVDLPVESSVLDSLTLDLDRALPLGLLLNEIVYRTAREDEADYTVRSIGIELSQAGDLLAVRENRNVPDLTIGTINATVDTDQSRLLSDIPIIQALVDQLNGRLVAGTDASVIWELRIPLSASSGRQAVD